MAALSVSGLPTDSFIFEGFLPKKPGKKAKKLKELAEQRRTVIIYESPYRVIKTLTDIKTVMGERQVAVCRELTKKFEEIIRGTVTQVLQQLNGRTVKGEIVLVVGSEKGLFIS
jgi:16S rRNA (cytidine1402-2'-O)-methyltransferase